MKTHKKFIQQSETQQVDLATGDVLTSSIERVSYMPSEPPYVKLYLDDVVKLYGLPKASSDLLHCLIRKMDYDGTLTLVSTGKQRIAKEINVKVQTIENNIQALLKTEILIRIGRGEYMFNPNLIAKGEWKNIYKMRNKFVELRITYGNDGKRTIKGELKS